VNDTGLIAALESHRRRGSGEAMTWAAANAGARAGCTAAVLQASELGAPVYERMGFRTVTQYRAYTRTDV
jgi:predicted N-acetyltransferase YhbS